MAVADNNSSDAPQPHFTDDGRVWLRHPDTGGVQAFGPDAADAWRAMGWVDTEPPEEPNPVLVEWPNPDDDTGSKTSRKTTKATGDSDTKSSRRGKTSDTTEEA